MNVKHLLTVAGLCLCASLSAQIKIGDNPQNLDATSVLELESNDRVLVITRISEAQMNTLFPLSGAMVYNTDAQCIFYYDGAAWVNLCDSLGLNFTTDPIVNSASTIVITENGDDVNFEVGEISSENILDFSVNSIDIQNNSITAEKLAPDSVGSEELQDNTVTDAEIDYNQVTLNDFINDAGFITGANIVSGNANNAITDNGGAFYNDSQLISDIAANTAAIAADGDTSATNELQSLSINADQLTITGGNTVTIPTADGSDTNIQGGTNINVTGAGTAGNPYIINNTFAEVDGSISNELQDLQYNPGTNILTLTNPATPGNQVDLSALAGGGGTDDQLITDFSLNGATNELSITIEDGNTQLVDLSSLATGGTDDQIAAEVPYDPTTSGLTATDTQAAIDEIATAGSTDDQIAAEVPYDPTTSGLTATDTQSAIDEIAAAGGGNPTDELNTTFAVNAGILEITDAGGTLGVPLTSIDTDDQDASQVSYDNTTSGLTATDTQAAIDEIAAAGGGNPTDELNTTFAVNAGILEITDAGGTLGVPLTSIDTDDQDASQVSYDNSTSGLTATDTQAAIDEIFAAGGNPADELNLTFAVNAGNLEITDSGGTLGVPLSSIDTDDQTDVEVLLVTPSDYDGDTVNETNVEEALNALSAASTDDQTDAEVPLDTPSDYDGNSINETTVKEALDALSAVSGGHVGTPNSIFFADSGGLPTEDNQGLYWDPNGRTFFGGDTGALYVGIDGNPQSNKTKVHIGEMLNNAVAYPLQLQNFTGNPNNGSSVGVLFSVDAANTFGKGALIYERTGGFATGDFHFLQNTATNTSNPILGDAVVTIKNNGDMGIGTTTPSAKLHINGNLRLENQLIDETNSPGNIGDVLTATATGTAWALPSAGAVATDVLTITGNGTVGNELAVADNGITAAKIADGAISGGAGGQIVDNSITASDLQPDSVDSSEIKSEAVGTSEIEDGSISTIDIADANVTPQKIAPGNEGEVLKTVAGAVTWAEPTVVAMGKANGGSGIEVNGAIVSSGGAGMNTVTLNTARPDSNYIIQLSVSGDNRIYVTSQVAGAFTVEIRENSTGNLTSAVWFFTVLDF